MLKGLKKSVAQFLFKGLRSTYSQSGEDIIISDLFSRLGIHKPTYLDIGANDPVVLSNTYRLYKKGSSGVCVEPNPLFCNKLIKSRPRDICIEAGVAFDDRREADYYIFAEPAHGLNTFSAEEAEFWQNTGIDLIGKFKLEKIERKNLVDVNEVINAHLLPWPNLISIDVEGLDYDILKTIDFSKYLPEVICVETLRYASDKKESKDNNVIAFLTGIGYFVYADTYINTIFCRRDAYKNLA